MRDITIFFLNHWEIVLASSLLIAVLPFVASRFLPNNSTLKSIKQVYKIVFTNWINVTIISLSVFVFSFVISITSAGFSFSEALFGAAYSVLGYGIMFWIGFIILMSLLDISLFGFHRDPLYISYKLMAEWLLISLPFIYWLFEYNQWIFLVALLAFLVGQFLRKLRILRILQQ